jgi:hypothetical protein
MTTSGLASQGDTFCLPVYSIFQPQDRAAIYQWPYVLFVLPSTSGCLNCMSNLSVCLSMCRVYQLTALHLSVVILTIRAANYQWSYEIFDTTLMVSYVKNAFGIVVFSAEYTIPIFFCEINQGIQEVHERLKIIPIMSNVKFQAQLERTGNTKRYHRSY